MEEFPPELQYAVAKILVTELKDKNKYGVARSTLLALRITSRVLASATVIKAALFKAITLRATTSHVKLVQDTELSFLAPFVQKVTLFPSPEHIDLNSERLGDIFRDCDNEATEAIITQKIVAFQSRASKEIDLLSNGLVGNVWLAFLRQLQIVDTFSINSIFGNHTLLPGPVQLGTDSNITDDHTDRIDDLRTGSYAGHVKFMGTVLQCLASVSSKVKILQVDCEVLHSYMGWWPGHAWQSKFILDNLHSLTFSSFPFRDNAPRAIGHSTSVSMAASSMLERWNTKLEHLEFTRYDRIPTTTLYSENGLDLRVLRSLKLEGVALNPRTVPSGILSMPNLRDVHLKNCIAAPWKPVFEAVHLYKKTKPLRITFQNVWYATHFCDLSFEFSLDPDLSVETFNHEVARLDGIMDAELGSRVSSQTSSLRPLPNVTDLYRYLMRRGPWTGNLEQCFRF